MTRDHFRTDMERLIELFPGAYKSNARIEIIWRCVSSLEDQAFTRIVDQLIGSSRQAPMVPDFEQLASIERERAWSQQKKKLQDIAWEPNTLACEYCGGGGVYLAHKGDFIPFAFRCHCTHGRADLRHHIPHFTKDHATEGFVWATYDDMKRATQNNLVLLPGRIEPEQEGA